MIKCNQLNYERQENIRLGLSRYPESITQQGRDPLTLLPIKADLRGKLQGIDESDGQRNRCNSQIEPDDYPNLSTLVGATYL